MSIQSMTGYSRYIYATEMAEYQVEIKSVNHKFLSLNVKVPRVFSFLEPVVHSTVQKNIKRGKVDVSVRIKIINPEKNFTNLNMSIAMNYYDSLKEFKNAAGILEDVSISHILSLPEVFTFDIDEESMDILKKEIGSAVENALIKLKETCAAEGEKLSGVLLDYNNQILQKVNEIEKHSAGMKEYYKNKLKENLGELLSETDATYSEEKLELELAIIAERADIEEEIQRIKVHCKSVNDLIEKSGNNPVIGAKLDFFCQEFVREFNTIGSKNKLRDISLLVIDGKALVNSLREQVQNIQ